MLKYFAERERVQSLLLLERTPPTAVCVVLQETETGIKQVFYEQPVTTS